MSRRRTVRGRKRMIRSLGAWWQGVTHIQIGVTGLVCLAVVVALWVAGASDDLVRHLARTVAVTCAFLAAPKLKQRLLDSRQRNSSSRVALVAASVAQLAVYGALLAFVAYVIFVFVT